MSDTKKQTCSICGADWTGVPMVDSDHRDMHREALAARGGRGARERAIAYCDDDESAQR